MNLFRISTPHRYETADKDTTTPKIQPHPPEAERCYVLKGDQTEVIPCISHRLKTGCQWQMFSVFPCCSRRRLWAAYTATTCAGRPKRTCLPFRSPYTCIRHSLFCIVFSKKFNIISALSAHRASTLPQKIDSREGLFRCKRGLIANASKVNTHCIKLQFAPIFGLFAAQYSAICC